MTCLLDGFRDEITKTAVIGTVLGALGGAALGGKIGGKIGRSAHGPILGGGIGGGLGASLGSLVDIRRKAGPGFLSTLKVNPKKDELDRVFKAYEKETGQPPSKMSFSDINEYVLKDRARRQK